MKKFLVTSMALFLVATPILCAAFASILSYSDVGAAVYASGMGAMLGTPNATGGGFTIDAIAGVINKYVKIVTLIFLSLCASCIVLFAIWVGFRLAKAQEEKERTEAKQQLIWSIIGLVSIALVTVMLQAVIPAISVTQGLTESTGNTDVDTAIKATYDAVGNFVNVILNILSTAAVIFAVYVGWQLMRADDDKKRTEAKKQLIWTGAAIIGVVLINTVAAAIINALYTSAGGASGTGVSTTQTKRKT